MDDPRRNRFDGLDWIFIGLIFAGLAVAALVFAAMLIGSLWMQGNR